MGNTITEPQRRRLHALLRENGWDREEFKAVLLLKWGRESTLDILALEYEGVCEMVQSEKPPTPKPWVRRHPAPPFAEVISVLRRG